MAGQGEKRNTKSHGGRNAKKLLKSDGEKLKMLIYNLVAKKNNRWDKPEACATVDFTIRHICSSGALLLVLVIVSGVILPAKNPYFKGFHRAQFQLWANQKTLTNGQWVVSRGGRISGT